MPTQRSNKILFWCGISLPIIALIAMSWLVHQTSGEFKDSFRWVMRTYKVLNVVDKTQGHIADAETGLRGYLLTGREDFFSPYGTAKTSITDDIEELKTLTHDNPVQQTNLLELQNMVTEKLFFDPSKLPPAARNSTNALAVILTQNGKNTIDELRRVLFQMRQEEENLLSQRQQNIESDALSSQVTSFILIGAVALALIFVVIILLRLEKLQQFVTICAWTGQVKHQGQWIRLDEYLQTRFGLSVSHGLSKEAAAKMAQDIEDTKRAVEEPARAK